VAELYDLGFPYTNYCCKATKSKHIQGIQRHEGKQERMRREEI
jgi:hypothetical protein